MVSELTEHVHFRISRWEKERSDKYKIDIPTLCRRALTKKIRDLVNDPELLVNGDCDEGPAAPYTQAWQKIMPVVTTILTREDFDVLKRSSEKLQELKMLVTSPVMKAEELENLGIFLQGGDLSERILMACVEAHS